MSEKEVYSAGVIFPLFSTLILSFIILLCTEKRRNLREFISIGASILQFYLVYSMIIPILNGNTIKYELLYISNGLSLTLRIDALSMIFSLLSSFLWIVITIYSIAYMRSLKEKAQTRYYFFFAVSIFSAIGVAFSGNLLTLYMFYELLTFSTYPLVAHKESEEAREAGKKYLVYLFGGALLSFLSIALMYMKYGTLDFVRGGFAKNDPLSILMFFLLFFGFGVKAAIIPFHEWLPTAMIAPTPVSALLHAVAVVKAGVFCVLRIILFIFGPQTIKEMGIQQVLIIILFSSVFFSNILAMVQNNLKKRLAFSTINNLSLIILGALLFNVEAMRGALLHMPFHGFLKITLFMCAGIIYIHSKKEEVSDLDSIGKELPLTMFLFFLSACGIAGIPPLCGFLSKWYLASGTVDAKRLFFLFFILFNAILDILYFFPIVYRGFFKGEMRGTQKLSNTKSLVLLFPPVITTVLSVLFFFDPDFLLKFFSFSDLVIKEFFVENG